MGWSIDVVFGSRNQFLEIRLMILRFLISGWAGQLSITTFLSRKEEPSFLTPFPKRPTVIQLFFWLLYQQENCLVFLKHRDVMFLSSQYQAWVAFSQVRLRLLCLSVELRYYCRRKSLLRISKTLWLIEIDGFHEH